MNEHWKIGLITAAILIIIMLISSYKIWPEIKKEGLYRFQEGPLNKSELRLAAGETYIYEYNVTWSTLVDSEIYYSVKDHCIIIRTIVHNSTELWSNETDSFINNSFIYYSTITDSTIVDSNITNSVIINSTIVGAIVVDAEIIDDIVNFGNITFNGTTTSVVIPTPLEDLINYAPIAQLSAPLSAEVNTIVIFNGSASSDSNIPGPLSDVLVYEFDFGDGNITSGNLDSISHSYSSTGAFSISLQVTDRFGESDTESAVIGITSPTVAPSGGGGGGGGGNSCITKWNCSDWRPNLCANGTQVRNCVKQREYCYAGNKPNITRTCIVNAPTSNLAEIVAPSFKEVQLFVKALDESERGKSAMFWYSLLGILIILAIVGWLFYRNRTVKQEQLRRA